MQELVNAVSAASNGKMLELNEAGIVWAEFCLKNFCGKLLKKGLKISSAIADFDVELQQREVKK